MEPPWPTPSAINALCDQRLGEILDAFLPQSAASASAVIGLACQHAETTFSVTVRSIEFHRSLLKTMCTRTHALTTKTPNYLITKFSCYSFLFRLILYKSYTLRLRYNLYRSFESTLNSLRALT